MFLDHGELKTAARAFLKEGHDLALTIDDLLLKITALGDVYGDDNPHAKQSFDTARNNIADYAGAICAAYDGVGDNLTLMNANIEVADWASSLPKVDRFAA
ncbi:hypothetical protein [Actinomadura sp. DC4]|uniref:hypothetical protein n=1 Tax=Actinomadura sp. DC4 TaxID=3055069 RepID=UPI0025AEF42D|nr:hypothetical protein [Actinomadura sp. DC4]MDN3352914.1 hypothetical protein [Actinomadura sp. DC4]